MTYITYISWLHHARLHVKLARKQHRSFRTLTDVVIDNYGAHDVTLMLYRENNVKYPLEGAFGDVSTILLKRKTNCVSIRQE